MLAVFVCAAGTAWAPSGAIAGPAILSTAQPDFEDPLSSVTQPASGRFGATGDQRALNSGASIEAVRGTDNSDFTIIGDQSTTGLQEPEIDDLTRAVRDEILGRSELQQDSDNRIGPDAAAADTSGSAAEIVRALVNTVPGQVGGAGPGIRQGGQGRQGDNSNLLASVIDETVTDLVVTLLNPEQATDGMVTFSIAGFGDFALLHLQENNSFFLVDLDGGSAIKITRGDDVTAPRKTLQRSTGQEALRPVGQKSNALQSVISFLEDNILPFVQSPITLATVGLFSIIWVIWRLSASGG